MAKKTTRRKAPAAGERKARKPAVRKPASAGAAKTAIPGKATATQAAIQAPSSAREKQDAATAAPVPFPVVAVGASAGGLEAFTELLRALPPDTGMSFVFIQHLSHTSESLLPEILSKATAMPVAAVTDDVRAKPSHVYVIPPNADLSFSQGFIKVQRRPQGRAPHMPVDIFMRSLAQECTVRAIGVILSGTGFDGAQGLAAIKAEGGIAFAQNEESAKYPDMPRHASAAAAAVDFTLPPDQIGRELAHIARHPYLNHIAGTPEALALAEDPEGSLAEIFTLIRNKRGVDFTHYKPATIRRRIARRMLLHKIDSLNEYIKLLRKRADEVDALHQDFLINVTSFFRDPRAFEKLQTKFLPKILKGRSRDATLRVWVPGCATGEEAYSVAISLLESLGEIGTEPPLQIFATDISERAIHLAREGRYPASIAADVSADRLRRFFIQTEGGYQIRKSVRDLCVFAVQNVFKDPPFSRMDLITCRNVLIYLETTLQERVLHTLHYALKPGGILFLGASETTSAASHLYRQEDERLKVYSKQPAMDRLGFDFAGPAAGDVRKVREKRDVGSRESDIEKEVNQIVLSEYAPAGVVINEAMDVVLFLGQTNPFLQPPPGKPTFNVLKMAHKGLVLDLRAVIQQARDLAVPATRARLEIKFNGRAGLVSLTAIPLSSRESHYMILFEQISEQPAPAQPEVAAPSVKKGRGNKKTQMDQELAAVRATLFETRRDLEAVIQEQESSGEELQSANEEILSSNEELQSTNEELQTAKEELQATNEELTTLNQELHNRNAELSRAHGDLSNLLGSIDVGVVMLGSDLRIRHFTPAAGKLLNLIPGDVGRPIGNIKPNLNLHDLEASVAEVVDTLTPREQQAQDSQGGSYSVRIRPYRTADNKIDGTVVAFVDIRDVKNSLEVALARRFAENIVNTVREPLVVLNDTLHVISANRSFYETFHVSEPETLHNHIYDLGNRQWDIPELRRLLEEIIPMQNEFAGFEVRHHFPSLGPKVMLLNARQIAPQAGGEKLILLAIEDVIGRN
jgi:two-component system CheB/CheR fusion protein